MTTFEERIENMAAAVHDQWMRWAQTVMDAEDNISPGRRERWEQYMVPYEELDEPIKEYDRIEARILIEKFLDGDPARFVGSVNDLDYDAALKAYMHQFRNGEPAERPHISGHEARAVGVILEAALGVAEDE